MAKKKVKRPSVKLAKDKAWSVVSQYIRRKFSDFEGYCTCITCGVKKAWKEMHTGHYIDGRNNTVLYDERFLHPQCPRCNLKIPGCLAGNKVAYTVYMIRTYGYTTDEIKAFDDLKFVDKPMKAFEHDEIRRKYEDKLLELN